MVVRHLSRNPACHFMKTIHSLPFLQELANCPFLSHYPFYFYEIQFNITLCPKPLTSKWLFVSGFLTKILHKFLFPPHCHAPYVPVISSSFICSPISLLEIDFTRWVPHSVILFICATTTGLIVTRPSLMCTLPFFFSHVGMRLNRQSLRR
jgi:hypothetical protein